MMKATDENTLGCAVEDQHNPERVRIESIFLPMASLACSVCTTTQLCIFGKYVAWNNV